MADITNLTNFLNDVAGAIKEKTGKEEKIPAANFDTEILSIEGGTDTSDATATAEDVLHGKTAYGKEGKMTGEFIPPEPIYGVSDVSICTIPSEIYMNASFSIIDNIFAIHSYENYIDYINIYKINDDNNIELLFRQEKKAHIVLVDVIDDDIYYIMTDGNSSSNPASITIYKYNSTLKQNEEYWTIERENSYDFTELCLRKPGEILSLYNHTICYVIDVLSKQITRHNYIDSGYFLTDNIISYCNYHYRDMDLYDTTTGITKSLSFDYVASVRFVNKDATKIILNDGKLYELTPSLETGSVLNENPYEDLPPSHNLYFIQYKEDYYYNITTYYESNSYGKNTHFVKFNEETNKFEYLYTLGDLYNCFGSGAYDGRQFYFIKDGLKKFIIDTKSEMIKGYRYNGQEMYIDNKNIVSSENILIGTKAYNQAGDTIVGTMPNNGTVEIIPSTEDQILSKGYVSGGKVVGDKNLTSDNIKKDISIFGVTGTLDSSVKDIMYELYGEVYDYKSTDLDTTLTKTCSVSCIPGNYVYAFLEYHGGTFDVTEEGWELLYSQDGENSSAGTVLSAAVYYKLAENTTETFTYTYNATGPKDNKYNGICLVSYMNNSKLLKVEYHNVVTYSDSTQEFILPYIQKGDLLIVDTNSTVSSGSVWTGDFECTKIKPFAINSNYGNIWIINENKPNAKLTKANVHGPQNIILLRTDVQTTQNLLPENIKKSVEIFGVEGTLEPGGTDTSDATVTSGDIIKGKIAYGSEGKVIGSYVTPEPIYGIDELNINSTNIANSSGFSIIDNIFSIIDKRNSKYFGQIYKTTMDNDKELLLEIVDCRGIMLLDVIEDDIYYCYTTLETTNVMILPIYKFNMTSKSNELYWQYELPQQINQNKLGLLDRSKFIYQTQYYFEIDLINKQQLDFVEIWSGSGAGSGYLLNSTMISNGGFNYGQAYNLVTQTTSVELGNHIGFINKDNTKVGIIINDDYQLDLYEFTADMKKGTLLKSDALNGICNISRYGHLVHYEDDYYYYRASSGGAGGLLKFNEDTNEFIKVYNFPSITINKGLRYLFYTNASYTNACFLTNTKGDVLKGYSYKDHKLYFSDDVVTTDYILTGHNAYNQAGDTIAGTMPNNGEINITPSTKEQTIPKGYTSGGVVSGDENLLPENIKKDIEIFGVKGTLESGTSTNFIEQFGVQKNRERRLEYRRYYYSRYRRRKNS